MWHVIAEEDMHCTECSHKIPSGTECLSQMPLEMPENFHRRKYENFCITCAECDAERGRPARPCYVRRLNHWYTHKERTQEPVPCGYCGETIAESILTVVQRLYDWPDSGTVSGSEADPPQGHSAAAGVTAAGATKSSTAGWHNLSSATQQRFRTGGLGRGLGSRSPAMARRLYEKEVPEAIRNMGEPAVKDFLKGKHFSHIRSVSNAPGRAKAPSNVVLENARDNLRRGSRNMTSNGRAAAKSAGRASAIRTGAKAAVKSGARAGLFAAAMEAVVAVPENILHVKRGRKSGGQAVKDAAKNVGSAAGVGVAAAGVANAAAVAGVGLSLGPIGVPIAIAGVGLMVGTGVHRLVKAAKRDLPLDEYHIFFCKNMRCKNRFARDITNAVRVMSIWVDRSYDRLFIAGQTVIAVYRNEHPSRSEL